MSFESSNEPLEFRDTRPWFQYALGGIAGVGIVTTVSLLKGAANGNPALSVGAGIVAVATVVALSVVYFRFGQTVVLRLTQQGIERSCGDDRQTIAYDKLAGFRSKWTDIHRNGVYQSTQVQFEFLSEDRAAPIMAYHASADYDTPKFGRLQEFQEAISEVVAERMADVMEEKGRVSWTSRLAITRTGLELAKRESVPERIASDRITQWKVDQGLFKLGVDGGHKPYVVEKTSEWNFFPGLLLFTRVGESPAAPPAYSSTAPDSALGLVAGAAR